jgi:hypothetical protein
MLVILVDWTQFVVTAALWEWHTGSDNNLARHFTSDIVPVIETLTCEFISCKHCVLSLHQIAWGPEIPQAAASGGAIGDLANNAAEALVRTAQLRGSGDDVTALVGVIRWDGWSRKTVMTQGKVAAVGASIDYIDFFWPALFGWGYRKLATSPVAASTKIFAVSSALAGTKSWGNIRGIQLDLNFTLLPMWALETPVLKLFQFSLCKHICCNSWFFWCGISSMPSASGCVTVMSPTFVFFIFLGLVCYLQRFASSTLFFGIFRRGRSISFF